MIDVPPNIFTLFTRKFDDGIGGRGVSVLMLILGHMLGTGTKPGKIRKKKERFEISVSLLQRSEAYESSRGVILKNTSITPKFVVRMEIGLPLR